MKGWLLLLAIAALLLAGGAVALPPPPPPPPPLPLPICRQEPVSFCEPGWGVVDGNFHPRRDGNRVFYLGSLEQARKARWARPFPFTYDPAYNFKKYGVLAVFYKGHSAGFEPEAQSVEESAAGDLSATFRLECYNAMLCATPPYDPAHPWGIVVLLLIDKGSLLAPPKTLHVTATAWG
jgi:hypothetical protein